MTKCQLRNLRVEEVSKESIIRHINKVLSKLESNQNALIACISGLKASQDGQANLKMGKSKEALPFFFEAATQFKKIPEARYMLGITNTDLSAAYANIGDFSKAVSFARDAIFLVQNNPKFAEAEANAHMTIGNSLYPLGSPIEAEKHYEAAKNIYTRLPNGSHYLQALDYNRDIIRKMYSD